MAAVAFSAYGIHWFALGMNRYQGNDPRTNAGMSVAFTVLSATGAYVFFDAGAWPVGVLFVGLTWVYVSDFFHAVGVSIAERSLGLAHVLTGLWLMYLTVATILNIASGTTCRPDPRLLRQRGRRRARAAGRRCTWGPSPRPPRPGRCRTG